MAKRRSLETPELPILHWRTSEEPLSKVITPTISAVKGTVI